MQVLVLYDWAGAFDVENRPHLLTRILENAQSEGNRLTVSTKSKSSDYRAVISSKNPAENVIKKYKDIESISIDKVINGNFLDTRFHLHIRENSIRRYIIGCERENKEWLLSHLQFICEYVAPVYGFVVTGSAPDVLFYVSGSATTGMSPEKKSKAASLMREVIHRHRYTDGCIHDLYGLNVISKVHLDREIDGARLSSWIESGEWGRLFIVGPNTYAWTVPDIIRAVIRERLNVAGMLLS